MRASDTAPPYMILPDPSTLPHPRSQAFHVRKKRKIYAMFIYDLFHTVLELPFLGLYPMVFCLYVLASGTCFKMLLRVAKKTYPLKVDGFYTEDDQIYQCCVSIFLPVLSHTLDMCEMNYVTKLHCIWP